jgi:formylglycine-generating enzyme required for sulfatase activity
LQPIRGRTISQYSAAGDIYDLVGSVDEWTRTERVDDFVNLPTLKNVDTIGPVDTNILALGDSYREHVDSAGSYDSLAGSYTSGYTKNDMTGIRCVQ